MAHLSNPEHNRKLEYIRQKRLSGTPLKTIAEDLGCGRGSVDYYMQLLRHAGKRRTPVRLVTFDEYYAALDKLRNLLGQLQCRR